MHRKGKGESGATVSFAFDAHIPALRKDQMLDDGEAKAGAAEFAGARLIDSVKPFKEPRQILSRNAYAGIVNIDLHGILYRQRPCAHREWTRLRGVYLERYRGDW